MQGERGDKFYVIEDGVFSCFDDGGREVARVGRGSCFGELALLRRDCRALNVMALADAKARGFGGCWALIIMGWGTAQDASVAQEEGRGSGVGARLLLRTATAARTRIGCSPLTAAAAASPSLSTINLVNPCLSLSQVLTLHRDQFTALLGSLEAIRNMWRFEAVKRVPLFSALPHGHKHRIAAALNQLQLPAGAMAVKEARRRAARRCSALAPRTRCRRRQPLNPLPALNARRLPRRQKYLP